MRVGAFLAPWGPLAAPEHVERFAATVEKAGFSSLWVGDHVILPRGTHSTYPYNREGSFPFEPDVPHLEPVTLLAYLAGRTSRVELGISVFVLPMRNPVIAAKTLGNLQTLSRGRLAVGIGVGWMREEFDALHADFKRRGAATGEYMRILRHLWHARPEPFEGEHYSFGPLGFSPRPDPIPLIVGGHSQAALLRAVSLGDGWHPLRIGPAQLRRLLARLHRLAEGQGRDPAELRIVLRDRLFDLRRTLQGPPTGWAEADRWRARVREYESAGVDDFILEFPYPGSPPDRQVAWLEWFGEHALIGNRVTTTARWGKDDRC